MCFSIPITCILLLYSELYLVLCDSKCLIKWYITIVQSIIYNEYIGTAGIVYSINVKIKIT